MLLSDSLNRNFDNLWILMRDVFIMLFLVLIKRFDILSYLFIFTHSIFLVFVDVQLFTFVGSGTIKADQVEHFPQSTSYAAAVTCFEFFGVEVGGDVRFASAPLSNPQ